MSHNIKFLNFSILAVLAASTSASYAAEKLYSPYVEKGELELEYFGSRSNDGDPAKDNGQQHQFSVGYGVNDWWHAEVYTKYAREPQGETKLDKYEFENIFQLTEPGEYWVDVGAALDYEYTPQRGHPDTVETRLLLAKDLGLTSHVLNIILEKDVGAGPKAGLEAGGIWSSRYRLSPYFQPGFEINSTLGEIRHTGSFDAQDHYAGPMAYGKIPLNLPGTADGIKYRIGYLFGVSRAASNGEAVAQLEYEIHL